MSRREHDFEEHVPGPGEAVEVKPGEPMPTPVHLGSAGTTYHYDGADAALLQRFKNPMKKYSALDGDVTLYSHQGEVEIRCPEFTSLCPITGQPDFATIVIVYVPDEWCVESKSLKLYLGSYRMEGDFHEACVQKIADHLTKLLDPVRLQVKGEFTPRGGIPFWPTVSYIKRSMWP